MKNIIVKGQPASGGIGIGILSVLEEQVVSINRGEIEEERIERELEKLDFAIDTTLLEIYDLKSSIGERLNKDENLIFEAYRAILQDKYFFQEVKDLIYVNKQYAENAVDVCMQNYIDVIENSGNEFAMQRIYDLNDIRTRLIRNLTGGTKLDWEKVNSQNIVIIRELNPSIAAGLAKKKVVGVVVEEGAGYLSHSAIILRSLGIPVLNGISYNEIGVYEGKEAIIDGFEGTITINPTEEEIKQFIKVLEDAKKKLNDLAEKISEPAVTKDGNKINIHANVSNIEDYHTTVKKKMDGIGVVRTEMMFLNSRKFFNEEEQLYIYQRIAKGMIGKPVVIRTADFGGDKIPQFIKRKEKKEYSSLRGIELSLFKKEQFKIQVRAILRATEVGNIRISFPMVNNSEDVVKAKDIIKECLDELCYKGYKPDLDVKIGAVVESRLGVANIENILNEVDFISLGTNDLIQEMSGLDRCKTIGSVSEYSNPEFLNGINRCVKEARLRNKMINICGEMASDPMACFVLLGMGIRDLSMNPARASLIVDAIKKINVDFANSVVEKMLMCKDKESINSMIADLIKEGVVF